MINKSKLTTTNYHHLNLIISTNPHYKYYQTAQSMTPSTIKGKTNNSINTNGISSSDLFNKLLVR